MKRMRPIDATGAAAPAAFVLGLDEGGYGVVRSLTRAGVRVFGFSATPGEFGRMSRRCEAHYRLPVADDTTVCRALIDRCAGLAEDPVLFCASDRTALMLARQRERLSQHFRFHWVNAETLGEVLDKARIGSACERAGVPVPRTLVTRTGDDPAELAGRLEYPCLIRPNPGSGSPFPARQKPFVALSRADLLVFYRMFPAALGATVCQQIIEGSDDNLFQCTLLMVEPGAAAAAFCTRTLRAYPPGRGAMCYGRSEDNTIVQAQAIELAQALQYRGVAVLAFKYRPADGRFYFLDMNPRLPPFAGLLADAGVNVPHLAWLDLAGRGRPAGAPAPQRDAVYWVSLGSDVRWFLRTWAGRRAALGDWLRSIGRVRSFRWFDWRDPLPFVRAVLALAGAGVRRLSESVRRGGRDVTQGGRGNAGGGHHNETRARVQGQGLP